MKMIVIICILLMMITGCAPSSESDDGARVIATQPPTLTTTTDIVTLTIEDITLTLPYPKEWETYTTEYGVVLAEYLGSVATEGQLGGILIHLFVPPLAEMDLPVSQDDNRAMSILREILSHPNYVGTATVSDLRPFLWDGLDCAYYLMDNGEGNLTIVIGIFDATSNKLVTVSMSAPQDQQERIRTALPILLDDLVINNQQLSGMVLDAVLPNPLIFPRHTRAS
ncbi:MAG: hypothetical protein CUN52_00095 [Phototrophicales bacterium]|nr:MAG: hypothetical protein CUN52_00095 [Phototrophicales bacterium]